MRRILGTVLLVFLLASTTSCGEESSDDVAADPTPTTTSTTDPTEQPTQDPTSSTGGDGQVDFTEIALVSETAAGGTVSELATALADADAVRLFAQQFEGPAIGTQLISEVNAADVPDGQVLVAAVIAIGCDVPPGVVVAQRENGLSITPMKVTDPLQECFAPVTTVALILVGQGAV